MKRKARFYAEYIRTGSVTKPSIHEEEYSQFISGASRQQQSLGNTHGNKKRESESKGANLTSTKTLNLSELDLSKDFTNEESMSGNRFEKVLLSFLVEEEEASVLLVISSFFLCIVLS